MDTPQKFCDIDITIESEEKHLQWPSQEAEKNIILLNRDQLHDFNRIIQALQKPRQDLIFHLVDGPGGTGKSFVYRVTRVELILSASDSIEL